MKRVYLDFAAATPVAPRALRAFVRAIRRYGNPSSAHEEGREAKAVLEEARRTIARELEVKSDAVIFTSGASEANALAIRGHIKALKTKGRERIHVLYNPGAHASIREVVEGLAHEGVEIEALVVRGGALDVAAQLRPETALVCLEAANGETGTRFDTRSVRQALAGSEAVLLVDASQLPLVESVERTRLGANFLTLDASKVGGVRGIGVLVADRSIPLASVLEGGGQERGIRSGTQMPALAIALAEALTHARRLRTFFASRAGRQRTMLKAQLAGIPELAFNEAPTHLPHLINFSLPGRDTEYLAALLNEAGFAVSVRSACETEASLSQAVYVETGDEVRARSTLRVSWGPGTSDGSLRAFARALSTSVRFLDRHAL